MEPAWLPHPPREMTALCGINLENSRKTVGLKRLHSALKMPLLHVLGMANNWDTFINNLPREMQDIHSLLPGVTECHWTET